jgi:hypothetical protein
MGFGVLGNGGGGGGVAPGFVGGRSWGAMEAGASEAGTCRIAWQFGHFTRSPTDSSRTRNGFLHLGQLSVIGMELIPYELEHLPSGERVCGVFD